MHKPVATRQSPPERPRSGELKENAATVLPRVRPARERRRRGIVPRARAARRRYHSHTPGMLYVGFTILLAIGAINSQNNLLFLALGLAIGGLLISGLLSGTSLMGVRVERTAPARGAIGSPLRIRYRVTNNNRFLATFGLHIVEATGTGRGKKAPWSRFSVQPRTFVVHVPPATSIEAEAVVKPLARGTIDLEGLQVWSTFPFGLTKKSVNFELRRTILILPPELPLRTGFVRRLSNRSYSGGGAENSAGQGEEFFGLREYIAGDSLRQIAWKRTARTGQVVVRQNAAPSPPRLWVMLDFNAPQDAPAGEGPVLTQAALDERAIALAASVLRSATTGGMAVGLSIPSARIIHPVREGRGHLDRLLNELALLEPGTFRGLKGPAPAAMSRSGTCLVVHAGKVDTAVGPLGSNHITASRAAEYVATDDQTAEVLAVLDAAGTTAGSRRRWLNRLRRHAQPPVMAFEPPPRQSQTPAPRGVKP